MNRLFNRIICFFVGHYRPIRVFTPDPVCHRCGKDRRTPEQIKAEEEDHAFWVAWDRAQPDEEGGGGFRIV